MNTSFALQAVVSAALLLAVWSEPAPAGEKAPGKVKLLCSFEKEELEAKGLPLKNWKETTQRVFFTGYEDSCPNLVTAEHATDGKLALCVPYAHKSDKWKSWPRVLGGFNGNWEKSCQGRQAIPLHGLVPKVLGGDWSGYDRLLVDVASPDADVWLRFIVEDAADTTPYVRYRVAKGRAGTIVFPLAKYAAENSRPDRGPFVPRQIDLARIVNLVIYLEEASEDAGQVFFDNLRLAAKDSPAPATPIEPTQEIERDWGWRDMAGKHPPIKQPEVKRETGPVGKLGPVTLASGYKDFCSYLGNDGPRFYRSIAAIDNRRIVALVGGQQPLAFATFDGGKTWGGLDGTPDKPTPLGSYSQVAWASADSLSGNAYIAFNSTVKLRGGYAADRLDLPAGPDYFDRFKGVGYCIGGWTMRCIGLRNIVFNGERWEEPGPGAVLDDFARHCIHWAEVIRHPSGRLWAFLDVGCDVIGRISVRAVYSDDNGLTWVRSHAGRYLHEPGPCFRAFYAAPYGDGVALCLVNQGDEEGKEAEPDDGAMWTSFDGHAWAPVAYFEKDKVKQVFSLVSWHPRASGEKPKPGRLFALFEREGKLILGRLKEGKWEALSDAPVVDDGTKGPFHFSILTVSGDAVLCLWVRDFEKGEDGVAHSKVLLRRYHVPTEKLGPEEELVTEQEPVSALAVPYVSPPDYVPMLWCNSHFNCWRRYGYKDYEEVQKGWHKKYQQWVKFLRVPCSEAKRILQGVPTRGAEDVK